MGDDADIVKQLAEAQAEILRLTAEAAQRGASPMPGTGTPEHFYAVGGQGDEAVHPDTGDTLLNPQTGAPIIQEHPRVAAQAAVDAAQTRVDGAQASLVEAQAVLTRAAGELAQADARYDEIVAHLVSQTTAESEA